MPFHPTHNYLHGGPALLEGGQLRRYGRGHSDAGALFFSEDTPEGRLYAVRYALWTQDPAVWVVRIHLTPHQVFDFAKQSHLNRLAREMSPFAWQSISASAREQGQLDWAYVDEEQMLEAGFRGALLHERGAGHLGARPVTSVAVFDAADVEIVGRMDDRDLRRLAPAAMGVPTAGMS